VHGLKAAAPNNGLGIVDELVSALPQCLSRVGQRWLAINSLGSIGLGL